MEWPLARRYGIREPRFEREAGAAIVQGESHPRHHDA
jgi:hypothetical protein